MNNNFDLSTHTLIVGGGPAGSTLARKLAQNDVDVMLIEKNFSYDKPCGGGIKHIVFEEFNIPKKYENQSIKDFILYSSKEEVSIDLSKTPMSIVLRQEFDDINRKLAQDDGAILIEAKYLSAEKFNDFLIVKIKEDNKIKKIKTKYLVGADGVKSSVRKDIFGTHTNALLTHYYNVPSKKVSECKFFFRKEFSTNEYTWAFPHGNKLSVGTVLNEKENSKRNFLNFKNKFVKNDNTKVNGFYIPNWNGNELFYKDKVFLVGDSAGQVLPMTFEGIYYAMKSAEILSNAIIKEKPEIYEEEWNKKYKKRFKFFKSMQKIFLSSNYMSHKIIIFFQNKKFQESALKYWAGTVQPLSFGQTVLKVIKHLLKN